MVVDAPMTRMSFRTALVVVCGGATLVLACFAAMVCQPDTPSAWLKQDGWIYIGDISCADYEPVISRMESHSELVMPGMGDRGWLEIEGQKTRRSEAISIMKNIAADLHLKFEPANKAP